MFTANIKRISLAALLALTFCAPAQAWYLPFFRTAKGLELVKNAEQQLMAGDYGAASSALNKIIDQRYPAKVMKKAYVLLGRTQEATGRLDLALSTYQIGLGLYQDDMTLLLALGRLYYITDLQKRAQVTFEKALEQDDTNLDAVLGLARTYEKIGYLEKSAKLYEQAVHISSPVPAGLLADYAHSLYIQRRYTEATETALKAAEIAPRDSDIAFLLANIYYEHRTDQKAFEELRRALELKPDKKEFLLARAMWECSAKRYGKAMEAADKVLASEPKEPVALWLKALILTGMGDNAGAKGIYAALAQDRDNHFIARSAQKMLDLSGQGRRTVLDDDASHL